MINKGYVRKIIDFSPIDGPGNRTVIFLQGCNFNCKNCHNPETIEIFNGKQINHEEVSLMTTYDLLDIVKKNQDFIQGVTISGGECTVQYEFLLNLVMLLKRNNFEVIVDTNGSLSINKFQRILDYVDKMIFDFKVFDEKEHKELVGLANRKVKRNIKIAAINRQIYEVRTLVIPEEIDNYKNVDLISKFISKIDQEIQYKLIKYRQLGVRENLLKSRTPSNKLMKDLKDIALSNGLKNVIIN